MNTQTNLDGTGTLAYTRDQLKKRINEESVENSKPNGRNLRNVPQQPTRAIRRFRTSSNDQDTKDGEESRSHDDPVRSSRSSAE